MHFKHYMSESLQDTTGSAIDIEIVQFILESFNLATQAHIYHLVTKSYAEHIAIGDFYEGLRSCVDTISESSIGLGLSIQNSLYHSELSFTYNKEEFISKLKNYRTTVSNLIQETNKNSIMSINDNFISVQQLIDTLLYKLQLS